MQERHFCADSLVRVQSRHALQQVYLQFVQRRRVILHRDATELREARFKVWQLQSIRPVVLVRRPEHFEDLKDLVDLRVTGEKWLLLSHFSEDAARTPQVDAQ